MGISLVEAELPGDIGALERDLTEAVSASTTSDVAQRKAPKAQRTETTDDDRDDVILPDDEKIPPKLRGKTVAEVAEMYRNLESAHGRQGHELGQLRSMTDRLLDLKRETDLRANTPPSRVEVKSQDLLENPTEVIDRVVQARIKALESESTQRLQQIEGQIAQEKFVQKHADYMDVANDPEFGNWINKSSFRQRAAAQARNGDWAAADDLLTEYKELRASRKPAKDVSVSNDDNVSAAKAAALESGSSPEAASKKGTGKIYRRVDLMALRTNKPDLYYDPDFQAEILKAYAEKRVK